MSLNNFKNRAIVWDTVNKGFPQPIQIMQGDVNARTLSVKIIDNGGEIDLTGYSLKLTYQYTNSSNSGFVMIPPENLTKGEFILVIPTEMTKTGVIEANLILLNEDKEQVIVSKKLTFISDNSTVTDLAQEVNNKIDDFTKLLLENMPQVMRSELDDLHAQTDSNKSNIDLKANQTDLESLQHTVNNQTATISTKANQTDLNNLQADVSRQGIAISTKAEQSDLLITNQNVTTAQETAKQAESEAKNAMAKATEAQANSLTPTTLNVAWEVGKYNDNNGETVVNESMNRTVKFDISGTVELNIKNPTNYTLYKYFLYDKNGAFLRYGEVKNGMSINHIGKIAFQTAKTGFGKMAEDIATTKSNFIFTSYISTTDKIDIIEDELKFLKDRMLVDIDLTVTYGKYSVGSASKDINKTYFSTQKMTLNKGSILKYTDSKYLRLELVKFNSNTLKCESVTVTNEKNINANGIYAIQGYVSLKPLTQSDIDMILADMQVLNYTSSTNNVPSNLDSFQKMVNYTPSVSNDTVTTTTTAFDYYKYPVTPIWGHEYLEHWYEKIYDGVNNISIALDGDSITAGYAPLSSVQDTFFGMKDYALKKIMKAGNYDLKKLSILNNGFGGRNTNEWVGNPTYALPYYLQKYPNGFLQTSMEHNPDLLIIGWGMNDADKNHTKFAGLTLEQRLNLFKTNMEEGLQRIRGNTSVNGRPAYNKTVKDLAIIITLPTVGTVYNTGRTYVEWFQNVRPIIQELCRKYECAFADFTARTYAHNDMSIKTWSALNSDGVTYGTIHPNKYSMAQIMSQLQDLIYPVCMWNIDID